MQPQKIGITQASVALILSALFSTTSHAQEASQASTQPAASTEVPTPTLSVPVGSEGEEALAVPADVPSKTGAPNGSELEAATSAMSSERVTVRELLAAKKTRQLALAVSGGVSLGSYEAGVNWAILRLIEESADESQGLPAMRLRAMTGASAGNINAFLAALEHCEERTPVARDRGATASQPARVVNNWFYNAWLGIGIDQLFPGAQTCEEYENALGTPGADKEGYKCPKERDTYHSKDGAFSRRAFEPILKDIRDRIESKEGHFRNGCGFPIGITVTKVVPERVEGSGASNLDVTTQRFAVLVTAEVKEKRLVFTQPEVGRTGDLVGNRIFLPEIEGSVPTQHLLDLILASSAFPVAFGPVKLDYCFAKDLTDGSCLQPEKTSPVALECDTKGLRCDAFIDGGLYDNLPIGLAVNALRSELPVVREGDQPVILYMDPDKLRWKDQVATYMPASSSTPQEVLQTLLTKKEKKKKREVDRSEPDRGVAHLAKMLGRFVKVARTYEMQSLVRFNHDSVAVTAATDRFSPIFGGYLGAFASFLSRPLREYDYHVGVYDGLFYGAVQACADQENEVALAACLLKAVPRYRDALEVPKASDTAYVVNQLLRAELTVIVPRKAWTEFHKKHQPDLDALAHTKAQDLIIVELHRAMALSRAYENAFMEGPSLDWVLKHAEGVVDILENCPKGQNARCEAIQNSDRLLFTNRDALLGNLAKELAQRLVDIERAETGNMGNTVVGVVQFSTELYFSGREPEPRWRWSPSIVPRGAKKGWRFLAGIVPHYVTAEVLQGGAEIGYLPTYYSGGWWGLTFPLSPFSWSRNEELMGVRAGAAIVFNTGLISLPRIELGPTGAATVYSAPKGFETEQRFRFGGELAVQLLLNRLRVSFDASADLQGTPTYGLRMGLSDFNGSLYWLLRALLP